MSFNSDDEMIPKEYKEVYAKRRLEEKKKLIDDFERKNFEAIAQLAHQWKGNARSFGFIELEAIAIDLEKAAKKQDVSSLDAVIRKFEQWLDSVKALTSEYSDFPDVSSP